MLWSVRASSFLSRLRISPLSKGLRETEVLNRIREEAALPFDLSRGPLIRAGILRLGDREHIAHVTMHHIVSDGCSVGVLINEIAALYEAFEQGGASPLPELLFQFTDYAAWQRTGSRRSTPTPARLLDDTARSAADSRATHRPAASRVRHPARRSSASWYFRHRLEFS